MKIGHARRTLALLLLLSLSALVGGCTIMRFGASMAGRPNEPAQYVPEKRPMAIVVKDRPDPSGLQIESDEVEAKVEQQLRAYEVAPIVPASRVAELRSMRPLEFATMTPVAIGKSVGAEQVVYVRITQSDFDTSATNDMLKGHISALVSVLDVKTGGLLWPDDGSSGATVSYDTHLLRLGDRNTRQNILEAMHTVLAEKIGRLFHDYKPED